MFDEQEKLEIIAFFDYFPIVVVAEYLFIKPKDVYRIYSTLIDTHLYQKYKNQAKKELNLNKIDRHLRYIHQRI